MLEIDAATHTQVDNVREVIIAGLGIAPVRNRYKIFIIDEVHQLSTPSFNALLKSIEEPPPHVVFMMATTELEKIPDDDPVAVAGVRVPDDRHQGDRRSAARDRRRREASRSTTTRCMLIARDADGSMRDAQSKLDQVIAFTGNTITADDVATVLGLVGRDLLLDIAEAVARRGRAGGVRARRPRRRDRATTCALVCRELSRLVARPAGAVGRSRRASPIRRSPPKASASGCWRSPTRFSREDLLRAFDRADARGGRHPRRRAAALSPRDGAAAVDPPAQARAADRPHRSDPGWGAASEAGDRGEAKSRRPRRRP